MRGWLCLCAALGGNSLWSLVQAPMAHAADNGGSARPSPPLRRSGFSVGLAGGLLMSSARGYPNDVAKIDVPEFQAHTGFGVRTGGALWLGGALADWLSLGVGVMGGGIEGNGLKGNGGVVHVRIEAFPLFYRGGPFQDLGVLFTAGTGGYTIRRGNDKLAEGAGTAAVGLGAFYEPWRLWQLSFGPQIEYSHQFSDSMSAHSLVIGMRSVFYGAP